VTPVPWPDAWQRALYGPGGFFTGEVGPAGHFRTAVHAAPAPLAAALARLARREGRTRVLDVGAGRGELLTALAACPDAAGLALHGVDVVARPAALPAAVGWSAGLDAVPPEAFAQALVIAWELLDDVPCPVLVVDDDGGLATVLVDARGVEHLAPGVDTGAAAWCAAWWPLDGAEPGDRVEVGLPRDALWAGLVRRAGATGAGATLLAVDYHHTRADRPSLGSLTGFRAGRAVPPVPDGSCDVTAHVAMDAVAAAGEAAGATGTRLLDQRAALLDLGVTAVPAGSPLPADAAAAARALAERSATAELLDRGALGGFAWLLQRA